VAAATRAVAMMIFMMSFRLVALRPCSAALGEIVPPKPVDRGQHATFRVRVE
jgi:hypothetical protein